MTLCFNMPYTEHAESNATLRYFIYEKQNQK